MFSTSQKILIARILSALFRGIRRLLGLPSDVEVTRKGIVWSLDLKEGIDLAIYILGGFEVRTLKRYIKIVREGNVVLDIGANIGAHSLPLAELVGSSGRVFAFEPTAYAFGKLKKNIGLNPRLANRIEACQMMLTCSDSPELPPLIYSSWPLEKSDDLHNLHHGRLMGTQGATTATLDAHLKLAGVGRVDFIKLDVDGNEADVLQGAVLTLERFKPILMLELAPYVYEGMLEKFDGVLKLLWDKGYVLTEISTGKELPRDALAVRRRIPPGHGMNVQATVPGPSRDRGINR